MGRPSPLPVSLLTHTLFVYSPNFSLTKIYLDKVVRFVAVDWGVGVIESFSKKERDEISRRVRSTEKSSEQDWTERISMNRC